MWFYEEGTSSASLRVVRRVRSACAPSFQQVEASPKYIPKSAYTDRSSRTQRAKIQSRFNFQFFRLHAELVGALSPAARGRATDILTLQIPPRTFFANLNLPLALLDYIPTFLDAPTDEAFLPDSQYQLNQMRLCSLPDRGLLFGPTTN